MLGNRKHRGDRSHILGGDDVNADTDRLMHGNVGFHGLAVRGVDNQKVSRAGIARRTAHNGVKLLEDLQAFPG